MVSTRRRVVNEQDRFGGYARQLPADTRLSHIDVDVESFDPSAEVAADVTRAARRQLPELETYRERPAVVEYSGRKATAYPPTAEYVGPVGARRKAKSPRRESEELMPTIKTRAYGEPEIEETVEPKRASRTKASGKTKAVLAVYMAVVAMLAVAVIATGIAVSNLSAEVGALEGLVATRNQTLIEQSAQIEKLTDYTFVAGEAVENGMEKVDSVVEVELVPVVDPIVYESRTNWFDRFCDWLSNMIGG